SGPGDRQAASCSACCGAAGSSRSARCPRRRADGTQGAVDDLAINVVVGALVSGTGGHLAFPWPLWVAGPYRAALLVVPAGVTQIRHSRPFAARRMPGTGSLEAPASLTS